MQENLLVAEAAAIVGCHPETLRRLDNRGILNAKRDYLNRRIFRLVDVLAYKDMKEKLREAKGSNNDGRS